MAHSLLPAVIVWACVLCIHVKSGKSNHQYHEPLIFYSQRVSPFRVEHSKNNYKDEIEKAIENDSFFYLRYLHTLFYYLHTLCLVKIIIRRKSLRIKVHLFRWWINFTPTSFDAFTSYKLNNFICFFL